MRAVSITLLLASAALPGFAQKFNPFENLGPDIPTPQAIVERMLEAGRVTHDDVVYDLGSGDGRVVITAAQKFGAHAVGVEFQPDLCRKAKAADPVRSAWKTMPESWKTACSGWT